MSKKSYTRICETIPDTSSEPIDKCFSLDELAVNSGIHCEVLNDFIDNGVIVADGPKPNTFSTIQLTRLLAADRLVRTFKINATDITIALLHWERIKLLENRVNWLKFACLNVRHSIMQ